LLFPIFFPSSSLFLSLGVPTMQNQFLVRPFSFFVDFSSPPFAPFALQAVSSVTFGVLSLLPRVDAISFLKLGALLGLFYTLFRLSKDGIPIPNFDLLVLISNLVAEILALLVLSSFFSDRLPLSSKTTFSFSLPQRMSHRFASRPMPWMIVRFLCWTITPPGPGLFLSRKRHRIVTNPRGVAQNLQRTMYCCSVRPLQKRGPPRFFCYFPARRVLCPPALNSQ